MKNIITVSLGVLLLILLGVIIVKFKRVDNVVKKTDNTIDKVNTVIYNSTQISNSKEIETVDEALYILGKLKKRVELKTTESLNKFNEGYTDETVQDSINKINTELDVNDESMWADDNF